MPSNRLLLVCPIDMFASSLLFLLKRRGFQCTFAKDGLEGLSILENHTFDYIFTAIQLEYNSGIEVVVKARSTGKPCTIVVITRMYSEQIKKQCLNAGADHYFIAPLDFDHIISTIPAPLYA